MRDGYYLKEAVAAHESAEPKQDVGCAGDDRTRAVCICCRKWSLIRFHMHVCDACHEEAAA